MEILKWKDKSWIEIPYQDKPKEGEECIIIAKRIYAPPPITNCGTWEVLIWRQDPLNDMAWDIEYSGLFWSFEDAELYAASLVEKIYTDSHGDVDNDETDFCRCDKWEGLNISGNCFVCNRQKKYS